MYMKKILSFVLSCMLLFSGMPPAFSREARSAVPSASSADRPEPEQLVIFLNDIYEQLHTSGSETAGSTLSQKDTRAVVAPIARAIFVLYETPGYKIQGEDFVLQFFPYIASFLEKEERQKGVHILHQIILHQASSCASAEAEGCQRALYAAVLLGQIGKFDKNSEETAALVNFLKIGLDTPFYPYIIHSIGPTLLAVSPSALPDALTEVKVSPEYGIFSGDYTLEVHSALSKMLVGDGFSRGMERSYYASGRGGRNLRSAWTDFGRFWAKQALTDGKLKSELDRLLAWCIKDVSDVRFRPFVAGVLSTGYIYKNPAFSQSVAKHMFKMSKGDLDPFTATYMENLLAEGFYKAGGQDEGFNKLLALQKRLSPEAKQALLARHQCPALSDFKEPVKQEELPRGVICQWRYASLDKINTNSFHILTVDVIGHAVDGIAMVFSVGGLTKLGASGLTNVKHFYAWVKAARAEGKSGGQILKMMGQAAKLKLLSSYQDLVGSLKSGVRGFFVSSGEKTAKAAVVDDLSAAIGKLSAENSPFKQLLTEFRLQLNTFPDEVSDLDLANILKEVGSRPSAYASPSLLYDLLRHSAAESEMTALLRKNPASVGAQLRAMFKNERFLSSPGFKYFEIIDGTTLVPAVEVKAGAAVGDGVMPFSEWLMRMANVDAVRFRINNENILLENPFTANRARFNELIVRIRQDESFGRVIGVLREGKNIKALNVDNRTFNSGSIINQLNRGETEGGIFALTAGESDPVVLLRNLYVQVRGQIPAAEASGLRIKVRLTSAELPEQLKNMHVHLEVYNPANGFLENRRIFLYGTQEQRAALLDFMKHHAPSRNSRFDVFEVPEVKTLIDGVSEADIPAGAFAQYAEMYA